MFGKKLMAKAAKPMMLAGALAAIAAVQPAQAAVNTYNVTETFNQVVYASQPLRDTYFNGSFSFDSDTGVVSNLQGYLSQAMTGSNSPGTGDYGSQNKFLLSNQLSSVYDATLGGYLVTTFLLTNTDTFSNSGGVANTVGWATGGTKEIVGNDNAYATIFVSASNPLAALTSAQTYKLAYADCTPGSLMGMGMGAKTCMTGWLTSAGGTGGTMMGVDQITQTITPVPEPESYALMLAGLGLMGFLVRRRKAGRSSNSGVPA